MKKISFLALVVCLSFVFSISAFAQFLSAGWPDKTIPIKEYSYNDSWQPPMDKAITSWNNASANITFSKSSSATNTVTAAQYADTFYGQNTLTVSGSKVTKFAIKLNSKTISADATTFANFVQSVFVHELGHSIWLMDNPDTTKTTIMNQGRDRNKVMTPQTYDIDGVKSKYK